MIQVPADVPNALLTSINGLGQDVGQLLKQITTWTLRIHGLADRAG